MRSNLVLGIIFANTGDEKLPELTAQRTIGSVPFGCRYRLIDFTLSAMVNGGITNIGVVTKSNYKSLLDHLGNGKPWDLARKRGGLYILSPFAHAEHGVYRGKIDALYANISFMEHAPESYVLIADANVVADVDVDALIEKHLEKNADITIAYSEGVRGDVALQMDSDGRVRAMEIEPDAAADGICTSLSYVLMKKDFLISLIREATLKNSDNFSRDVLKAEVSARRIYGFATDGYAAIIRGMQSYYRANMALLQKDIRDDIFQKERPVLTKLRDDMPARYGFGSNVENSLIADGCVIDGEVRNCIVFRGVRVEKHAVVENSILMQGTTVGSYAKLGFVIADKNVVVQEGRTLIGAGDSVLFIGKGITV